MTHREAKESRRHFLQQIGFDAAAVLLPIAAPWLAQAQCAPPGNTSSPSVWGSDCRALKPRRPASTLTTAEIQKLKNAYQAIRALDTSDPGDPRGFTRQAQIHCYICFENPALQVHGTQNFLPWHRAYLYFHERILGKLVGDMDFRLPYWDWENPSDRKLPAAYVTPASTTNPLWNGTRAMTPMDTLPAGDVDLSAALNSNAFATFSSTLELGPHGAVHVDVGGNMGFFQTAAYDPIFYAHHSNVDKAWADWTKSDSAHTNPNTAAWLNQSYGFYDENKVWRSIKNSQVIDNETSLRYYYGTRSFEYLPLKCIFWQTFPLTLNRAVSGFTHTAAVLKALGGDPKTTVAHLVIVEPQLPQDVSAIYSIYISEREATEDRGPDSPGFMGIVSVVLGDKDNHHPIPRPPQIALDVSGRLRSLVQRTTQNQLFITQRTPKANQKRVMRLPFTNLVYRIGQTS